ncbi:hypothetical protein [Antarctobacter sp.]|uniref:hypothetical protein n=1 Tax=Antarctobacter sp. TaxID=1872577 RepID=UPI002B26C537|nr:hypothetical protein [Antarctobacter sp.]
MYGLMAAVLTAFANIGPNRYKVQEDFHVLLGVWTLLALVPGAIYVLTGLLPSG